MNRDPLIRPMTYDDFRRTLPYDNACFKAIHNSYAHGRWHATLARLADVDAEAPRGVEIDVVQCKRSPYDWCVKHGGEYDGKSPKLGRYLGELRQWSEDHPGHDPILVTLDLKSSRGDGILLAEELDGAIERELPAERLYRPDDLRSRGAGSLWDVARKVGWPTVDEMRGRFVLVISGGDESKKRAYANTEPEKRLCFVDQALAIPREEPVVARNQIFLNLDYVNVEDIEPRLGWVPQMPGLITRGYYVRDRALWESARRAAINVISVDDLGAGLRLDDFPFVFVVRAERPAPVVPPGPLFAELPRPVPR